MKNLMYQIIVLLMFVLACISCRTEEMELITPPEEEVLGINSSVANLIKRTVTNDGSYDNIIDGASCFDIELPVTVIANSIEVVILNEDDLDTVEAIFDEFTDDTDTLIINFPITIIKDDYSALTINSQEELNAQALLCNNSSDDDDIECIDFQYPITANIFNQNNEQIDTIVFNNDEQLFDFIEDLDSDTIVVFEFPITVIFSDGTTQQINDFQELATVIEEAIDDCDEDDDNDPNDDDCETCTVEQLEELLTTCEDWMVDKLERNDEDLEDIYVGYLFTFNSDGTLIAENNQDLFSGTWQASGSGNTIEVIINIPSLSDFNDTWNLHEIQQNNGENKVDLRTGEDRLRFESDCNSGGGNDPNDTILVEALTNGDWYITYFFDDTDQTNEFNDWVFNFAGDGTGAATNSNGTTAGTWSTSVGDETELELNLNFGQTIPLDELAEDWDVLEVTQDIIRLKDISGGDGSEDFLTFEREPTGGGGNDLETILSDGTWIVASYLDDGNDETGDYTGYEINFANNGDVTAENGNNTNNGTWQVLSAGNTLLLDFGFSIPFEEFNDDWDVLSTSTTLVELQDVSGGNGGIDTLILEKL